jgi:hypothetical protein
MLTPGEFVLNRNAVANIGVAPLQAINQAGQGLPSYANQAELDAAAHPPGTRFHWKPTNQEYVTT